METCVCSKGEQPPNASHAGAPERSWKSSFVPLQTRTLFICCCQNVLRNMGMPCVSCALNALQAARYVQEIYEVLGFMTVS